MIGFIRSSWILLVAIFVAGMLDVSASSPKAMASDPMEMGSGGQDCEKCDSGMDMLAGCLQSCQVSSTVGLADQAMPSSDLTIGRFDLADVTFAGRSPPPAFTPPRTTILG